MHFRNPLAPISIAFTTGIGISRFIFLPYFLSILLSAFLIVAVLYFLIKKRYKISSCLLLILLFFTGFTHAGYKNFNINKENLDRLIGQPVEIEGIICDFPESIYLRERFTLRTLNIKSSNINIRKNEYIQINVYNREKDFLLGEILKLKTKLRPITSYRNPNSMDYAAYMKRNGIKYSASIQNDKDLQNVGMNQKYFFLNIPYRIKKYENKKIDALLPPTSALILKGILIGERTQLPNEIEESFKKAGVYHILALSGFNVGLIALFIYTILSMLRIPQKLIYATTIICLITYALIVGLSPSVVRATIMCILFLFARLLNREASLLNILSASCLIILAWNPLSLMDIGFELTFMATIFIIFISPIIESNLSFLPLWFSRLISISASAQLGVIPLLIYYFNQLSVIAIISNIFIVPLTTIITYIGMISLILSHLNQWMASIFFQTTWLLIILLRWFIDFFASLSFSTINPAACPLWVVLLFYFSILFFVLFYKKSRIKIIAAISCLISVFLLLNYNILTQEKGKFNITFLDVGQGDATLIEFPSGKTMLIDAGASSPYFDTGGVVITSFLRSKGIKKLDIVVLTHIDPDHTGGLKTIIKNFSIGEIWDNIAFNSTSEKSIQLFNGRKSSIRHVAEGDSFQIDGVVVRILNPPDYKMSEERELSENDRSIVLHIKYKNFSALLTGDIGIKAEEIILSSGLEIKSRVLKIPHHGSKYSSTPEFIKAVSPEFAIISSGRFNLFGHPSKEVVNKLQTQGIGIFRIDKEGAVIVSSDGNRYDISSWQKIKKLNERRINLNYFTSMLLR